MGKTEPTVDELAERIRELEQQIAPRERLKAACSRREFIYGGIVGAAGLAAMTGTASAQTFPEDFHGMALLIGQDEDRPEHGGGFFKNKSEWNFIYFAEDTGARYVSRTGDKSWSLLDLKTGTVNTEQLHNTLYVATSDNLNSALSNAAAGDAIHLLPGTHTLTKTDIDAVDLTQNGLTIKGDGTIKLEDAPTADGTEPNDDCMLAISGDDITIRDITIDGNKSSQSPSSDSERITGIKENGGSNYKIINIESKNHSYMGFGHDPDATLGTKGLVKDSEFHNHEWDGIVPGNDRVRVLHNLVYDGPRQDAIEPIGDFSVVKGNIAWNHSGAMVDIFGASHCVAEGNIAVDTGNGPQQLAAFDAGDGTGTIVKGNEAIGNLFVGTRITGATAGTENLFGAETANQRGGRVANNVSVGQAGACNIGDGQLLDFVDNAIIDTATNGIAIKDGAPNNGSATEGGLRIIDNHIERGRIRANTGTIGVTIKGNRVNTQGEGTAIELFGDEMRVVENDIRTDGNSSDHGIRGRGSGSHHHIINNRLRDYNNGIWLQNNDECVIRGNDTYDTTAAGWGIKVEENDGNSHSGFVVKDNWGAGVQFTSGTGSLDDITLRDNTVLTSPGTANFDWSVSPTTYIIENQTGWTEAERATATFSGDGATTVFTVSHGLSEAPEHVVPVAVTSTAATAVKGVKNLGATSFDVEFESAPASGTNNVDVNYEAKTAGAV